LISLAIDERIVRVESSRNRRDTATTPEECFPDAVRELTAGEFEEAIDRAIFWSRPEDEEQVTR